MRLIDADKMIENLNKAFDEFIGTEDAQEILVIDGKNLMIKINDFFVKMIETTQTVDMEQKNEQ